ncbi:MAG: tRNA lysidine(34) synthetase TilS [Devosia sp.]|uniref:tRNA lysidine(34) synthetase TilS n=1 Tax=Devosia sp. TaxID=1871048 RepID=UPI0024CBC0F8|nr:tRNA lysidine(34) synthetase TilS [Devosia sp.]UYN98151.1 MAG: tRNA lysidine(34) synthetase TilS [Devosia sp.]
MPGGLTPDLGDPAALEALFRPAASHKAIGLAVSGGPDSLALMLLAQRWAESLGASAPRFIVYAVDHQLRPEAADEVAMVARHAAELGLSFRGLTWTGDKPSSGLQEAARQARYGLIRDAMAAEGVDLLLTAHHRADQAETVLMRLAHGSGMEGLKGMSARSMVDGLDLFRPLLDVEPAALARIVEAAGWQAAQDPSNTDTDYERVRWRKLLPALAAEGLDAATLSRFAQRMGEADRALADLTDAAFAEMVQLDGFGAASLPGKDLLALSPAIGRRLLARIVNIVGGRQKPHALGQVERLYEQLETEGLARGVTLLGAIVRKRGDALTISREPGRALPPDRGLAPGQHLVWDERFLIRNVSSSAGLVAGAADFMPRHRIEEVLGFRVTSPSEAIRTAPLVRDAEGGVLALGGWSFDERITVQLLID